jgi:hypothetical protein
MALEEQLVNVQLNISSTRTAPLYAPIEIAVCALVKSQYVNRFVPGGLISEIVL